MKTLTIKDPWASLIIHGYKKYEFRSWKTSYRGKILIHSSINPEKKIISNFKSLNLNYNPGYIIGEATIKDCLPLTKEFNNKLIKENKLIYGDNKNRKGYAWELTNIKKYEKPFKAKGSLSLWEYYSKEEIMNIMANIKYGYLDKSNQIHLDIDSNFPLNYILSTPKEVLLNKVGICWDQVELERTLFKGHDVKTYFIVYYGNNKCPTHTFLTLKENNKYYWFEHSWELYKGIHEYDTLKNLLLDVKAKFIKSELKNKYQEDNLKIIPYKKPQSHLTVNEFYAHCEQYEPIILKENQNE